jgi:hypothetical protein
VPKLGDDFLRQIFARIAIPAVRVADLIEDLPVLIYKRLKPFL